MSQNPLNQKQKYKELYWQGAVTLKDRSEAVEAQSLDLVASGLPPAPKKYEPRYVWKFKKQSFAIKVFLWVYGMKPHQLDSFCKLWWGCICMPITLPMAVLLSVIRFFLWCFKGVGKALVWVVDSFLGVAPMQAAKKAREAKRLRLAMAKAKRKRQAKLAPPPPPKGPSLPARVATAVGKGADHVVDYFQEHPKIGQTVDVGMDWLGKIIVRGILYPLMVLVPLTVFAFAGWQLAQHSSGLSGGFGTAWDTTTHGVGVGVGVAWKAILLALAMGIVGIAFILFISWMVFSGADDEEDEKPRSIYERSMDAFGHSVGKGIDAVANSIAWVALLLWFKVLVKIGHAFSGVGKFLVLGHHSVKSRTCPRIMIEE